MLIGGIFDRLHDFVQRCRVEAVRTLVTRRPQLIAARHPVSGYNLFHLLGAGVGPSERLVALFHIYCVALVQGAPDCAVVEALNAKSHELESTPLARVVLIGQCSKLATEMVKCGADPFCANRNGVSALALADRSLTTELSCAIRLAYPLAVYAHIRLAFSAGNTLPATIVDIILAYCRWNFLVDEAYPCTVCETVQCVVKLHRCSHCYRMTCQDMRCTQSHVDVYHPRYLLHPWAIFAN